MTATSGKRKTPSSATTKAECGNDSASGIRYSCDYCFRDISSIVRLQCAVCGLPDCSESGSASNNVDADEVDLCVECFAAGVEFGAHKKTHAYRILRPLDFSVFDTDWLADEELLFLEAVESNGVGNWLDISTQLGTRDPAQCCDHYMKHYMTAEVLAGPAADVAVSGMLAKSDIEKSRHFRGESASKKTRLAAAAEDDSAPTPQSVPSNHEIAGFMPCRGEFETEIENEAEIVIKDLVFDDVEPDDVREIALRSTMLEIYSGVLDRRQARRSFVIRHGLVDFKRQLQTDKTRSKEERDLYTMLKPYARFMSPQDFQVMLNGLVREEELRRQIAHLQDLRRHGMRSFDQIPAFESEKKHLELYLKGGTFYSHAQAPASAASAAITTGPIREPHPLPAIQLDCRKDAPSALDEPGETAQALRAPVPTSTRPAAVLASEPCNAMADNVPIISTLLLPAASPSPYISPSVTPAPTPAGFPVPNSGRKASTPLNISHADGVEMLSEKERHLCSILRLYPRLYLSIKDTLIREYLKIGALKRAQARAAVKIDVNKTSKLYDFFISAGWIKPPASGE